MKNSESGEQKATRQCWECLKRRLVCNRTLPHCNKCLKAGKECPGYDEQKPLQWVETGKVTSRRRRKDCPPKIYKAPQLESMKRIADLTPASPEPTFELGPPVPFLEEYPLDPDDSKTCVQIWKNVDDTIWGVLDDEYDEDKLREYVAKYDLGGKTVAQMFALGGRAKIEEVVLRRDHEAASKIAKHERHPLRRVERLLRVIQANDLPCYDYLSNETNEVVQAVSYYNLRIHPIAKASGVLAPNPNLNLFPLHILHLLPPAMHHTLVCLAINHYIQSLPSGTDKSVVRSNRSKVYHHRGEAIHALSRYLGRDKTRCSDLTIASILMFLSTELQNPTMADWRSHASGMQRLIEMRGGIKTLISEAPHMAPTLGIYTVIVTMANTCTPSWDPIEMSGTFEQNLEDIKSMYNLIFPHTLCPPAIFFDILRINDLRKKASASLFVGDMDPAHYLEAHHLLVCIESFIPEDWAQSGAHYEEWLTIGTAYQAAAAVYCTMSLQSLTILPSTLEMDSMRKVHGDRLLESLRAAIKSPILLHYVMWPLTVAGVEAGHRDSATQYWVEKQLEQLSRVLGTSSPLKAQTVMRRYWQKEEPGWDECFDRPAFLISPWGGA